MAGMKGGGGGGGEGSWFPDPSLGENNRETSRRITTCRQI